MKTWDAIVIGAGIIGVSLALELTRRGLRVLVVDKGEPGREASWAAGGMLVEFPGETRPELRELAHASAQMYPEFVRELETESGLKVDLRSAGTILIPSAASSQVAARTADYRPDDYVLPMPLGELEPALSAAFALRQALFVSERCVDPRDLMLAVIRAARRRGVDFSSGNQVESVETENAKAVGVRTSTTRYAAGIVVNCAGAWAGEIGPHSIPTRPVKGQMLCVVMPEKEMVKHVIRTPDVYLIPRSDGRMLIGATVEEAGFNKQTVPETILKLRNQALELVPALEKARILEAWAGLRPGTPDGLPILSATPTPGYFVATGHFRDGILLAPVTARLMGQMIVEQRTDFNLAPLGSLSGTDTSQQSCE